MAEEVPEVWPPEEPSRVVPVFPLHDVWLVPGRLLQLHVFEPRYRQMVEDSLDGPGHLVIGTVVDGHENEMSGSPPIYPLAGLGEIAKHERLEDGRFHILIVGLYRVRIQEVESDRLYRRVRAERVHESTGERDRARSLHEDLQRAVLDSIPEKLHEKAGLDALGERPLGHLADLLSLQVDAESDVRQKIFQTLDVVERADLALAAYEAMRRSDGGDPRDPGEGDAS